VKVQFHWDRYGKMDINSSCWIRVSQHHAGAGGPTWGMIDIPRKNEEVIVSFLDGDPDRPIITGRVYNGDNLSPYPLKGAGDNAKHKKRRGNITKSYEAAGYNEFSMDDTEGAEQIRLHAQYDMDQHVKNDSREHVEKNRHLIVDKDQYELINENKSLHVKKNHTEHIEGNMELQIGGGEGGNLDLVVEKKMTEDIGGGYDFHLGGDRKVLIDSVDSLEVGGNQKEKIGGGKHLDVGLSHEQKVGIKHAVEAGQEIHLKAGMKVIIEAGVQISLVGPGGFVDIGPAGVTIQGIMVKINSGGAAGSGSGASPDNPDKPDDAKRAEPTKPDEADVYRP
jgi:type VI secretion system secreted protein VgrG